MWTYLIDCIRPALSLKAESRVLGVDCSTLALQRAIQEVARVKLDPRLGGVHFQDPPASSMIDPRDKARPCICRSRVKKQMGRSWEAALRWESDPATQPGRIRKR